MAHLDALPTARHRARMSTLAEIEKAVPRLSTEELAELERFVREVREEKAGVKLGAGDDTGGDFPTFSEPLPEAGTYRRSEMYGDDGR